MQTCVSCGFEIDSTADDYDGLTVVPAGKDGNEEPQWWHASCRNLELKKRVAAASAAQSEPADRTEAQRRAAKAKPRPKAGAAIIATTDDDPEV